jgi:hypothetical protein
VSGICWFFVFVFVFSERNLALAESLGARTS